MLARLVSFVSGISLFIIDEKLPSKGKTGLEACDLLNQHCLKIRAFHPKGGLPLRFEEELKALLHCYVGHPGKKKCRKIMSKSILGKRKCKDVGPGPPGVENMLGDL